MEVERVDDLCDALARRALFIRRQASEETPDGGLYSRYAVTHALVQEVCEERGSPARRQRWHHAIADHLERAYAGRTPEIAHVLAAHLDKARARRRPGPQRGAARPRWSRRHGARGRRAGALYACLLYTSDAADERS